MEYPLTLVAKKILSTEEIFLCLVFVFLMMQSLEPSFLAGLHLVLAGTSILMFIPDELGVFIFCRTVEKTTQPMKKINDGKVFV